MPLAERLVVHAPGPFRQPVVDAAEEREQRARYQHVVEVRDDVVRVVQRDVDRHDGQHQAGKAAHREQEDETDGE